MQTEERPAIVGTDPKQAGDTRTRWGWVEPDVWTDRMLNALENGVKGGKWFSLKDKVSAHKNLRAAWKKVKANKGSAGVDRISVEIFGKKEEENLLKLHEELKTGRYQPKPVRRQWIPKPGSDKKRPLGIPVVRDRVVQGAMRNVIEPIWEVRFGKQNYGFRPGRSCKDALRQVDQLLKQGYHWVVDADIQQYFDTIDHELLIKEIEKEVADGAVIDLIGKYLKQEVMDGMKSWSPSGGTPQGAVISPLLSNIYLHPVDLKMSSEGYEMVRYADDLVILCRSEEEAQRALDALRQQLTGRKLTLNAEKTKLVDASQAGGFDFLGYHFERGYRWPRKKSIDKMRDKIRNLTPRANGHSMEAVIAKVNTVLRGWFHYFKHSHWTTFPKQDAWVRMRLRSILRKRKGRKGCGRGRDHQRWPNAYFTEHGLYSLSTAHAAAIQSQ